MGKSFLRLFRTFQIAFLALTLQIPLTWAFQIRSAQLPFQECWRFNNQHISKFEIASDNESKILIPLLGGTVQALDKRSGKVLWTSELGGEIFSNMLVKGEQAFIITKNSSPGYGIVTVRAISASTGITVWQENLDPFSNGYDQFFLSKKESELFVFSSNGDIYSFQQMDGHKVFHTRINERITAQPVLYNQSALSSIFFVPVLGKIIVFSLEERSVVNTLKVSGAEIRTLSDAKRGIVVADQIGNVFLLDQIGKKILWKARTGAEIKEITEISKGFVVSSNDNYVYLLSKQNGRRIWKRKLSGRQASAFFPLSEIGVYTTLNGGIASFIDGTDGKIVNQISLEDNAYFISRPLLLKSLIALPTNQGIFAYDSKGCALR